MPGASSSSDEAPVPGRRVVFLFLDGVGIGPDDEDRNPFLRARLPTLRELLGGTVPVRGAEELQGREAVAFPLDAVLGVDGLPQSGTGQTALLTGRNAPRIFGRHFGPWPPARFRPLLEAESLFARTLRGGRRALFANAYPAGFPGTRPLRTVAAPVLAARGAGLLDRHREALARGEAVATGIVNGTWRALPGRPPVPEVTPREAGRTLARLSARSDLTFFAHFETDHAGHRGGREGAVAALERVDAFLAGLTRDLPDDAVLVAASDHGNIEDLTAQHTRNPALGLLVGPGAHELRRGLEGIGDLAPAVLSWMGIGFPTETDARSGLDRED